MTKTPICDFVKQYGDSKCIRMHMPGHKGFNLTGAEKYDITEIDGADVLYSSDGIIRESENIASSFFGTARTVYSAEGSSLSIRAMIYLTKIYATASGKKPLIAAGRNAHKTFITAAALNDIEIEWLFGENDSGIISCRITAEYLESHLSKMVEKPVAVYITSPDYLGNIADIGALNKVCKKYDILLLADNAHGAYMKFLPEDIHPITLGADMCCDSAHKTLPVLTGGAYLHISKSAPQFFLDNAECAMSVFASTSPSYLILQSLDASNKYISETYTKELNELTQTTLKLKSELSEIGYRIVGDEALKLTLAPKSRGYTGYEISKIALENDIVCEFSDPDHIVFMLTPQTTAEEINKLKRVLTEIPVKRELSQRPPVISQPAKKLSPREALFSPDMVLPVHLCEGKVLSSPTVSCPPAVPIVVCGEIIDKDAIECFEYYSIASCRVVKQQTEVTL